MSSIAGPSSHAFSSLSANARPPTAISTRLHRIQDAVDTAMSAGSPATPVPTTAPTTAPPTPIGRSSSGATDARETSMGPTVTVNGNGNVQNGTGEKESSEVPSLRDPKAAVVTNLDAVKARTIALGKKNGRDPDEEEAMVDSAVRIAERIAEDQRAALFPDVDTPFVDIFDVVKRLLPFHVFQQPREDLNALLQNRSLHVSRKGKRKATEEDLLREEIADTKFALECWKRKTSLEKRIRRARIVPGKRTSPTDQGYWLAQAVVEVERAENAIVNAELRSARAELDKLEREKRASAPPPPTPSTSTPRTTPTLRTSTSSNYYSSSTTTSTPTTTTFMPPYRPTFSYSYSQYPTTQYTYNPHAYSPYTPASTAYGTSSTQAPGISTTVPYNPTANAATTASTSAASAQVQQAQTQLSAASSTAIPVQLPVSSLTALAALGIVPVAAASLPPAGQPQPPAVIKSTNGTMLSLEINLSLLQNAQMSGLVLILNALTSRGVNVDGSSGGVSGGIGSAATSLGVATNGATTSSTAAAPAASSSTSAGTTTPSPAPTAPPAPTS